MNISSTHVPFASVEHLVIFFHAYSLMVPKQYPPLFFKKLAGMTWRLKTNKVYFFSISLFALKRFFVVVSIYIKAAVLVPIADTPDFGMVF